MGAPAELIIPQGALAPLITGRATGLEAAASAVRRSNLTPETRGIAVL
jgi:hypothetical protein